MDKDNRRCGADSCIIDTQGQCWCGQKWDGEKMCFPIIEEAQDDKEVPN